MAQPDLTLADGPAIPEVVVITNMTGVRFTPNDIRLLKAETGRTMEEIMGPDGDDGDRMQTMVWLNLRRQGIEIPWEQCGDVTMEFREAEPDPTSSGASASSPRSAASGG